MRAYRLLTYATSEKAYKDKIRDWGLNKNLKQRQAVYMLKMAKKRKEEEGKSTTFYYRGNQVSNSKIRRFSKAVDTSSDIVCKLVCHGVPWIQSSEHIHSSCSLQHHIHDSE